MSKRVLVVEDHEDFRAMLALYLSNEGYDVAEASSAREALSVLRGGPRPWRILLDLQMPEMDGFELFSLLKNDPELSTVKVIVLTALPPDEPRMRLAELPDVLMKPIDPAALLKLLHAHERMDLAAEADQPGKPPEPADM